MNKRSKNRKRHNKRRRVSKFVNRKLMKHKSGGGGAPDTFVFTIDEDTYTIERRSENLGTKIKYNLRKNIEVLIPFTATKEKFTNELSSKYSMVYNHLQTYKSRLSVSNEKLRSLMNYIWATVEV